MSQVETIQLDTNGWVFAITVDGRRIVQCDYEGEAVLRKVDPHDEYILNASSFPVGPYCNRIESGQAEFEGTRINLSPNLLDRQGKPLDPSSMIGVGWTHKWHISQKRDNSVEFTLPYSPEDGQWPWFCTMKQKFLFNRNAMEITSTLTNTDDHFMPGGLGIHFYWHREPGTKVFADIEDMWEMRPGVIPTGRLVPLPADQDFAGGLNVDGREMDNCYPLPDGKFIIERPNVSNRHCVVESDEQTRQVIVYTTQKESPSGPAGNILVIYPNTHVNNAVNMRGRKDTGMWVLRSGEAGKSVTRVTVQP